MASSSNRQVINDSCSFLVATHAGNDVMFTSLYSLLAIFIIVSNITLMVVLFKINTKLTRFDWLFLLLSTSDLMVGLILMPLQIYLIHKNDSITCIEVGVKIIVNCFTATFSGLITCLIANDRYIFMTKKKFHKQHMTSRNMMAIISVLFIICVAWAIVGLQISTQGSDSTKSLYFLCFSFFEGFILIEVVTVNIRLYLFLERVKKTSHDNINSRCRYRSRVNRTILIISTFIVIAYTPSILGFLIGSSKSLVNNSVYSSSSNWIVPWILLPTFLNAGINSTIFMSRNNKVLAYISACHKKKSCSNTEVIQLTSINSTSEVTDRLSI